MATGLDVVNSVLRRLRLDAISSFSTTYQQLILEFVNESKREVEDAWEWTALRTKINVATVASTATYTLTGATNRSRILSAWNSTAQTPMHQASQQYFDTVNLLTTVPTGNAFYYRVRSHASTVPIIELLPVPNSVQTLKFECVVPQDDFTTANASSTNLVVPSAPVVLGAWMKAIMERGENQGSSSNDVGFAYREALSDAIAIDSSHVSEELIWRVV